MSNLSHPRPELPMNDSFVCPHCGADVPVGAKFCRECGADEEVGWNDENAWSTGYDTEVMDDEDYEDFVRREFPNDASVASPMQIWKVLIVLALLASFLMFAVI